MSKIREGMWLCKFCGTECRGRSESCSECGAARQPGTKFYLPENSPYVTVSTLLEDAHSGVDWNCDHCGGANKGSVRGKRVVSCVHCGNAREKQDKDEQIRRLSEDQVLRNAYAASEAERKKTLADTRPRESERRKQYDKSRVIRHVSSASKQSIWLFSAGAVMVLGLVWFLVWSFAFARYEQIYLVQDRNWHREITIEQFKTISEEGWNPPVDASITSSARRISHYKTVVTGVETYNCGQIDMGNGYFKQQTCTRNITRSEPVYGTYFYWTVDRWVYDRSAHRYGKSVDRVWPEVSLTNFRPERQGRRIERLWFILTNDEETRNWSVDETDWLKVQVGDTIFATTDWWGRVVEYSIDH